MTNKPSAFPERDDEPALPERIWILGHNTIHSAKNPAGFYYVVEPAYPNAFGGPYIPEVIASERESRAREEGRAEALQLPRHACGLHINHNQHKDYYESAEDFANRDYNANCWIDEEQKARAIAADSIWEVQWYPDTPVGCFKVCAPTLEEALAEANRIQAEDDARVAPTTEKGNE